MDPRDLNAGLQDQRLALEFLQENIHVFGGDPTKVCHMANTSIHFLDDLVPLSQVTLWGQVC